MQRKSEEEHSVAARLRKYQVSEGLPWRRVAERLGISVSMLMMVLRGDRRLSAKALFRLEEAERAVESRKSVAERVVESLIGGRDLADQIIGTGTVGIPVEYVGGKKIHSPVAIQLTAPSDDACRKLRGLFAETLDTRLIALACLPEQLRSEGLLDHLSGESRARLTNAALDLVIPDWRGLVVSGLSAKNDADKAD